jgi:hypothetical protein
MDRLGEDIEDPKKMQGFQLSVLQALTALWKLAGTDSLRSMVWLGRRQTAQSLPQTDGEKMALWKSNAIRAEVSGGVDSVLMNLKNGLSSIQVRARARGARLTRHEQVSVDEGGLVGAVHRITNAFSFIQSRYENFSLYIPAIGTGAKEFKQYSMDEPRVKDGNSKVQQVAVAGLVEGDQMRVIPEVWMNHAAPEGAPGPAPPSGTAKSASPASTVTREDVKAAMETLNG